MAGSTSEVTLSALVAQDDSASMLDAVNLARTMSLRQIRMELDYDFLQSHSDEAAHFFSNWLPHLDSFEGMAVANWIGMQYVLSMVHVDHSYYLGARLIMKALGEVTHATAESLEGFRIFTEGPDAEVADLVADRFDRLAATMRAVHDEIDDVLESLPQ